MNIPFKNSTFYSLSCVLSNSFTMFQIVTVTLYKTFVTIGPDILYTHGDKDMRQDSKPLTLIDIILATAISSIMVGFLIQQVI